MYKHGRKYRMRKGRGKWHYLGENLSFALIEFARLTGAEQSGFLFQVFDRYLREEIPKKAASTQKTQIGQMPRLKKIFGHMHPQDMRQSDAIAYIDKRGKVAANREIALLRHVLTKCVHWDYIASNPLKGLQYRHPEKPRDRVLTSQEMWRSMRRMPDHMRVAVWLGYLTGLRRQDILSISRFDCKGDGIHIVEGKTGKRVVVEWNDSLRNAVKRRTDVIRDHRLFPISGSGFDTAWQRLMKGQPDRWQFKDLRAKHAADLESRGGDATKQLGHSSRALTQKHYLRKGRVIKPVR